MTDEERPADASWYQAAPPPSYGQPPAPARGTDVFAVGAIVTAVFGMAPVAVVLAVLSLSRTRRTGQSGRGLAWAALMVAALWVLATFAIVGSFLARGHT